MQVDVELQALKLLIERRAKEFVEDVRIGDAYDEGIKEILQEGFRAKEAGEFLAYVKLERDAYERACHRIVQKGRLWS